MLLRGAGSSFIDFLFLQTKNTRKKLKLGAHDSEIPFTHLKKKKYLGYLKHIFVYCPIELKFGGKLDYIESLV